MTYQQFTDTCQRILDQARGKLPVHITSNLVHDELATNDKPGRKALKFCMWCGMKQGFWDRDYSSYHLIYDPQKELDEALLQVRFMFFLRRQKTGGGKFNSQVRSTLARLSGKNGFDLQETPQLVNLRKLYFLPAPTSDWEKNAAQDIAWLIEETWDQFDSFLAASELAELKTAQAPARNSED